MSEGGQGVIELRVCLAVVQDGGDPPARQLLLVPHDDTGASPAQWHLPGGRVRFGEALEAAALRAFREETGLETAITGLLDITEALPLEDEPPTHSVTITLSGQVTGGQLPAAPDDSEGAATPRWFTREDLVDVVYHPAGTVEKVLGPPQRLPMPLAAPTAPVTVGTSGEEPPTESLPAVEPTESEVPAFLNRPRPLPDLALPGLDESAALAAVDAEPDDSADEPLEALASDEAREPAPADPIE